MSASSVARTSAIGITCTPTGRCLPIPDRPLDDRPRVLAAAVGLPRIDEHRFFRPRPFAIAHDLHLRPERIGRMFVRHHADLLGREPHQRADGEEADEVDEPAQQLLVERRVVLLAHDRLDAVARQPLAVDAVAAQRVVDVGDADDLRAEIEAAVADVPGVAGQVLAQMMLEGDNRRQRRHLRRAAQDVRAVDDVPLHEVELFVGQLVRLVQHLLRRVDLADVVHQRGKAELAQQRAVHVERSRLRHRQHRHVHHVREGVVVVALERRQRHQRRAIPADHLRQAVDDLARGVRIRLVAGLGLLPELLGGLDGGAVDLPRRHDAGVAFVLFLLDGEAPIAMRGPPSAAGASPAEWSRGGRAARR
jgi:hypothetical protein